MKKFTLIAVAILIACSESFAVNYWTPINTGLTNPAVFGYAYDGTNLYAATNGGGVYRSSNSGTNWTQINSGLTFSYIYGLLNDGAYLYAAACGLGVFISTNQGNSWTFANTGITNARVSCFVKSGTYVFAGTEGGIFRTNNNGTLWTPVNTGLTTTTVYSLIVCDSYLFAGTGGGGVFRSNDNGISWTAVNSGLTGLGVNGLAASGSDIYVATGGGVYRSTNYGTNWTLTNCAGFPGGTASCLTGSSSAVYAGTGNGVFVSTDFGASWTNDNTGLVGTNLRCVYFTNNTLYAGSNTGGAFYHQFPSLPTLSTLAVGNILSGSAVSGGTIINPGSATPTVRGICWNTTGAPTTSDYKTTESGSFGAGTFSANMTGLTAGGKYYVRAYATNSVGTAYGNEITFTTIPTLGEWGLIAFGSLVAILGGIVVWRKLV